MSDVLKWIRDPDAVAAATADQIREKAQDAQAAKRVAEDQIVELGRMREALLLDADDDKIFALDREIQTHSLMIERLEVVTPLVEQALAARVAADALAARRKARFAYLDALVAYAAAYAEFTAHGRRIRDAWTASQRHLDGIDSPPIASDEFAAPILNSNIACLEAELVKAELAEAKSSKPPKKREKANA
ncbi:hypothetical protein CCR97_18965 [Rhodoplanes elegans]|uniref:Uncharacterized protein n=1 Tax=Rhodoplanes elegans TaxID=29408 RepID=A0A327KS02_9BRAD|nr:hypothetical protein [Rhodoplanes elegans]MBK5960266.1 hypothetical protein [Rhodoplanes elegans]RAI40714.1 hypothetical protein CH338_05350 [Rhodoplanes elegans]